MLYKLSIGLKDMKTQSATSNESLWNPFYSVIPSFSLWNVILCYQAKKDYFSENIWVFEPMTPHVRERKKNINTDLCYHNIIWSLPPVNVFFLLIAFSLTIWITEGSAAFMDKRMDEKVAFMYFYSSHLTFFIHVLMSALVIAFTCSIWFRNKYIWHCNTFKILSLDKDFFF